ncbi:glycosyltransferase family protein [Winogradskyella alexanderae]|uniref:Glycosyltransferase involved in cell wall biosynthesis n=1 Tax=Winogradskyella alexanderae TaxID=2877123 RepID=A0ABS7XMU5_9FLAO|nr:hypothetical protein [Winogradskyella alexanderae]MCA0131296.1 hypothetical protein [Winogradskyella alexanderae]
MKKQKIYISLPANINFSVFEATKLHGDLFASVDAEVVYLSRNKTIVTEGIVYFNNTFALLNYLRKCDESIFYAITVFEVLIGFIASRLNRKLKLYFWVQGLIDEEDYHSNESKLRYIVFNKLLKFSVKVSSKIVVVTNHMFNVLIANYGCKPNKDYLLVNCKSRVHYNQAEKIPFSLCYIGGLSKWQNVDQALQFFNTLCEETNNYKFYLATFNHEEAKTLIENNVHSSFRERIELISVKETNEVEDFLSKMEFGFLIRDNILLNNVASPIKLAEYLSCGINPIISSSLLDYIKPINKNNAGIILSNNQSEDVESLLKHKHSTKNAIKTYNECFGDIITNEKLISFLS